MKSDKYRTVTPHLKDRLLSLGVAVPWTTTIHRASQMLCEYDNLVVRFRQIFKSEETVQRALQLYRGRCAAEPYPMKTVIVNDIIRELTNP